MTATDKLDAIWARLEPTNDAQTHTEDVPALVAAVRAVLDLHVPGESSQGYTADGGYGYISPYCAGCEASDEYAVEWPCRTVRAIEEALNA